MKSFKHTMERLSSAAAGSGQGQQLGYNQSLLLDAKITTVRLGLSWDIISKAHAIDLDASVALMNSNQGVDEMIFYGNQTSKNGAVVHSGDDRSGHKKGEDEAISIDLSNVPLQIQYIVFFANIFTPGGSFDKVRSGLVCLYHGKEKRKSSIISQFQLTNIRGSGCLVACIARQGAWWSFHNLAMAVEGRQAKESVRSRAVHNALAGVQTRPLVVKTITVAALEGRDLVGKDVKVFRKSTSDPYVVMKFGGGIGNAEKLKSQSNIVHKSLNPRWNQPAIITSRIAESETKSVKIDVYDHDDYSSPDFMGHITLEPGYLYRLSPGKHRVEMALGQQPKSHKVERVSGTLTLEITVNESGQSGLHQNMPAPHMHPGPPHPGPRPHHPGPPHPGPRPHHPGPPHPGPRPHHPGAHVPGLMPMHPGQAYPPGGLMPPRPSPSFNQYQPPQSSIYPNIGQAPPPSSYPGQMGGPPNAYQARPSMPPAYSEVAGTSAAMEKMKSMSVSSPSAGGAGTSNASENQKLISVIQDITQDRMKTRLIMSKLTAPSVGVSTIEDLKELTAEDIEQFLGDQITRVQARKLLRLAQDM